jgi:ribosome silencing factor RsfS/YbeB/iojap
MSPNTAAEAPITTPMQPEELAQRVATLALEFKAHDLAIIDLRGLVDFTDIFVVCTATNPRQVRAIAEGVKVSLKRDQDLHPNGVEGLEACKWVLVDWGDVVLHVFDGPLRGFYDLDGLWRDAPRLENPDVQIEVEDAPLFTLS